MNIVSSIFITKKLCYTCMELVLYYTDCSLYVRLTGIAAIPLTVWHAQYTPINLL